VTFGDIVMTLVDLARHQARKTMQVVRVECQRALERRDGCGRVALRAQNRCGAEMRRPIVGTQADGAPHRVQRLVQFAGPHARPTQFHAGVGVARVMSQHFEQAGAGLDETAPREQRRSAREQQTGSCGAASSALSISARDAAYRAAAMCSAASRATRAPSGA
jgi:hypothetical protein